tara:strand:+ start:427 stop:993 length:567 start_codon:yes stop_codon:yes gene_type:complete
MSLIPFGFWAASGAGGAGAFDLLETQTLASNAASITFTALDTLAAGYQHLQIRFAARSADSVTGARDLGIRLNGDTGTNYSYHNLRGTGSAVQALGGSTTNVMFQEEVFVGNSEASGIFGSGVVDILDYNATSKFTTIRTLLGYNASSSRLALSSGSWRNTDAVTSVLLYPNSGSILAGSRFSIYGRA